MNNTNQADAAEASKPPERPHDTPGMMLRKSRENANITLTAVGEALHLTVHYIKALENDDYSKLPGATFVKGYLRAYARFLMLDVNAVLASYEKINVSAEELSSRTESLSRNQKRHDQTFRWAVVTAVIIVLGVAAGWWFVGKDQLASTTATTQQNPLQEQVDESRARTTAGRTASPSSATGVLSTTTPASTTGLASTQAVAAFVSDQDNATMRFATAQSVAPAFNQSQVTTTRAALTTGKTTLIDTTGAGANSTPAVMSAARDENPTDTRLVVSAGAPISPESKTVNKQTAGMATNADPVLSAIPEQQDVALTITPTTDGARQVTLITSGTDMLQLYFKGASLLEIDDGAKGRLFNHTLGDGDAVTLHGTAPFKLLLGDATQVELSYNSEPISLSSQIRHDKTARFSVGAPVVSASTSVARQGANP